MSEVIVEKSAKIAKIYKLFTPDNEFVYYGSTHSDLRKRLSEHKSYYKVWKNEKGKYITSCKLFETEMPVDIVLVEKVAGDKEEIKARERYHIEANTCVNKNRPGRTQDEWKVDNRDKVSAYGRAYNEANKDKREAYREENKEHKKAYDRERYNKLKALAKTPLNPEE